MTREELLVTAGKLVQPGAEAAAEFSSKREQMAGLVNARQAERPDLAKLVGADGQKMSEDNNRNFSLFMESLFVEYKPAVFVDTVLWVFRTYRAHGFSPIYWPANLGAWREILQQTLSEQSFESVAPLYTWLITNVPSFTQLTEGPADPDPGSAVTEH